jgi:hypothetical protein
MSADGDTTESTMFALPLETAVDHILANIPKAYGGSGSALSGIGYALGFTKPWYPLKVGTIKPKRHVMIYSFDARTLRVNPGVAKSVQPLTEAQRREMRRVMDAVEDVANVRFIEAGTKDPDFPAAEKYTPEKAYLCCFGGYGIQDDSVGLAKGMDVKYGLRDLLVAEDSVTFGTMFHELSHAVAGICHPENQNQHPAESAQSTVMVEASDKDQKEYSADFGVLDAAGWQRIFGKSKNAKVREAIVKAAELIRSPILYREAPVTLDLSDVTGGYRYNIDLMKERGIQVTSLETETRDGQKGRVLTALAPGTHIQHVRAGERVNVGVHMRGNALDNELVGGNYADTIMGNVGNDTLTGNGGEDKFRFVRNPADSCHMITDFQSDRIEFIIPNLKKVELRWREDFVRKGETKARRGTEIRVMDSDDKVAATVFAADCAPADVQHRLFKIACTKWNDPHYAEGFKEEMLTPVMHVATPLPRHGLPSLPPTSNRR